ncbi:MAG: hypothetical protein M3R36_08455 [Bacteroidota bacterium]|nr:hypothetical protein [Bacteroidota bacterium]
MALGNYDEFTTELKDSELILSFEDSPVNTSQSRFSDEGLDELDQFYKGDSLLKPFDVLIKDISTTIFKASINEIIFPDSLKIKSEDLNYLSKIYGDMPLEEATILIRKDYLDAYQKVNILGFSFSVNTIPFALLFFLSIFLGSILISLKNSFTNENIFEVNKNQTNEEILEPYLRNKILRFIIWIIFPLVTIIFSIQMSFFSAIQYIFIIIWMLVNLTLGIWSYKLSK